MDKWQVWIDRGGTFTDVVARSPQGELVTHKLLSINPECYSDAAVYGIRQILGLEHDQVIEQRNVDLSVKMGTTVATNALLERKGDRTLFVTTRGFGDALRIGYQNRPGLFDRHIVLPEMLYEEVLEVDERLDANGDIVIPLEEERTRSGLEKAYANGIRSVAIALMHGYKNPEHEEMIAAIAQNIGFSQISVSNRVSPLMKLISRGDTTVVDGYLSPILRRYVDQVAEQLGEHARLMFMQSSGGLSDASLFQGKDAILSGPAGGVIGMVQTAAMNGFDRVIGFDMGGTSTDVSHYNGTYERSFETVVAGVRMRAPMMHIHTVAAGGGSILQFDGARFRVGPESAGADPGPACYRRGGPLTVTDCNVMLGKIQPRYFPRIFGPKGDEPLDDKVVREKFAELAREIFRATGQEMPSPEQVAEGFLKIAVLNMANAIKRISVQRGYDVTEYVLNCFGGAGGQHACLVADALGMKRVMLHPFAGVLSAYGMGLADVRVMRLRQVEKHFDDTAEEIVRQAVQPLTMEVKNEISRQGVAPDDIIFEAKVHLRYEATDTSLLVASGDVEQMHKDFEAAHKQQFGFIARDRKIIIEAVSLEGVGQSEVAEEPQFAVDAAVGKPQISERVRLSCQGNFVDAPLYLRQQLQPGQRLKGPAVIVENTGTVIVEAGWQAMLNERKHLLMERYKERARTVAVGTEADPVMLEVFNNLFMSIAEQMGVTLAKTSYSVNIKERLDFSCAIFDRKGQLVANAPHVPVHLGSMGESVAAVIRHNSGHMRPGHVYMLNAPYNGGTHLPDVTVITPVFDKTGGEVQFYLGSRGHHADIGGRTPGSSPPDSTHIEQEGVLIDNFLLVEDGRLREKEVRQLLTSGPYPCRNIEQNLADLAAQVAANETGMRELVKLTEHYGLEVVQAYMQHVQDNAMESVRRVLDVLADGSFTYQMDGGSVIKVKILVDHEKREAVIDFRGTSLQDKGNYNAPLAVTRAAVLYVFRTLVEDEIPLNEGCLKPLKIIVEPGTMISPQYPAAVISGNTEVSQMVTDCLFGALGVLASSQGTMNNFVYGDETYQNYETICGGTGAGPDHPGTSAVHSHMTNTRMTDPEVVEWRFPVRVESFRLRRGSGGRGKYRGGDGVVRQLRFLQPMTATILSSHRVVAPYGLQGGGPGMKGENSIIRSNGEVILLRGNDEVQMQPGDIFCIKTPGGGGFGKGSQTGEEDVRADVHAGCYGEKTV